MQTLTSREYSSFKTLARMPQEELHKTLYRILKNTYGKDKVRRSAEWVYAVGDIPIALVAHMDTVFKAPPKEIFYDRIENVIWSPQGLGADDRAGVFSILQIISQGYRPHVIFTTDEEWGGIGASSLARIKCPFKDLKYIIELDRRNINDCVFYYCESDEFTDYIESFGFKYEDGTYSDIVDICPAWEVAGVNLSVGYQNEHTVCELLFVSHMQNTISKVKNMLDHPPIKKFDFIAGFTGYRCACDKCGKPGIIYEMIPVFDNNNGRRWYCGECAASEEIEWCRGCYEGFIPGSLDENDLCEDCRKGGKSGGFTRIGLDWNSEYL